jgi:hypothetical protein
MIVHLLNKAFQLHLLRTVPVELVRAMKWQEMASFEVIPQFLYAQADGSHRKICVGSTITRGPPNYEVSVANTKQPRSVIHSSESNNSIQTPLDMSKTRNSAGSKLTTARAGRCGVRIPAGVEDPSLLLIVQTDYGPPPHTQRPIQWIPGFFAVWEGKGLMLTTPPP